MHGKRNCIRKSRYDLMLDIFKSFDSFDVDLNCLLLNLMCED